MSSIASIITKSLPRLVINSARLNNGFSSSSKRLFSSSKMIFNKPMYTVTYELGNGEKHTVQAKEGDNLLDVVINNDVDIDGFGACEGTLACSTCHLIFTDEDFKKIDEEATDEELDMLDLAFGLTDTSRLGCQVTIIF